MKVLKIGADWCLGCVVMKPRWKKIEEQFKTLKTQYYDYDTQLKEVEKYLTKKDTLPVFVFLNNKNEVILKLNGEVSEKKLIEIIQKHIND